MTSIRVHVRKRPDRNKWQLFYRDSWRDGRRITKQIEANNRRDALREAAKWEAELQATIGITESIGWDAFRLRFTDEYLPSRARQTQAVYMTALNQWERLVGMPPALDQISAATISRFQARLRKTVKSEHSIKTYLKHLQAALGWAVRMGYMRQVPRFDMPITVRHSKGRPLTHGEFVRLLRATRSLPWCDRRAARRLLRGLWLSGMRLGESLQIAWNSPPIRLCLDQKPFPVIQWSAEGHKNRKQEVTPITPDFAAFLRRTPPSEREGRVFAPLVGGKPVAADRYSRLISSLGELAGIRVGNRHATAHDLRRSFATRWAQKVRPITLKTIMRHGDIKTTLAYYVDCRVEDVGAELWNGTPAGTPNPPRRQNGQSGTPTKTARKRR